MEEIADLVRRLYVAHRARFRRTAEVTEAGIRSAAAGSLNAGLLHWSGVEYGVSEAAVDGLLLGLVTLKGHGKMITGGDELHFVPGDVLMAPPDRPYDALIQDISFALLMIPWQAAAGLAETQTGVPAAALRFDDGAPVSAAHRRTFTRTAEFIGGELITSGATDVSPLILQEMTRLAATVFLETFPNTTMSVGYQPSPGWVAPANVRRATGFIDAYADGPVTLDQIAAVAGVSGRAVQYAFRRYYGTTPMGYLRQVRLERIRPVPGRRRGRRHHRGGGGPQVGLGQPGAFRRRLPAALRRGAQQHPAELACRTRQVHERRSRPAQTGGSAGGSGVLVR